MGLINVSHRQLNGLDGRWMTGLFEIATTADALSDLEATGKDDDRWVDAVQRHGHTQGAQFACVIALAQLA